VHSHEFGCTSAILIRKCHTPSRKGYPVFAERRYQRGHGLGSIFGGLFKAAMSLLKKGTKTLEREALKMRLNIAGDVVQGINVPLLGLPTSGLFSLGRSF
jgi:hypothetical protein